MNEKPTMWPPDPMEVDRIPLLEFVESVQFGTFTDTNGWGYYANEHGYYKDYPAVPSQVLQGQIRNDFPLVAWFAKP